LPPGRSPGRNRRAGDTAQPDDPTQLADPPTDGSAVGGDCAGLTSHRSRTVVTDLDIGERQESTAIRMSMEMGEMILTEAGVWMEMPGLGWYQLGFTAAELAMSREQFMALAW